MKSLEEYKQSVIWHVVTGKYEVLENGKLRKRKSCELIENCPKGWLHYRFKDRCEYIMGQNIPKEKTNTTGEGYQFLRTNDVFELSSIKKDPLFYNGDTENLVVKNKEDLLICTEGFNQKIGAGTLGVCTKKFEGIISDHLRIVRINASGYEKEWLEYYHQSWETKYQLVSKAVGSIAYRASHVIPEVRYIIPTAKELKRCIEFLNNFVSSLPDPTPVIKAKEAFKKSLIWHIVTGKYEVLENGKLRKRKSEEMKDSGIGWIGKIPLDLPIKRVKDLGEVTTGWTPEIDESSSTSFIRPGSLKGSAPLHSDEKTSETMVSCRFTVLISCIGTIGTYGYASGPISFNQQVNAVNCPSEADKSLLGSYLECGEFPKCMEAHSNETTLKIINATRFKNLCIPNPPLREKTKITQFINNFLCSLSDPNETPTNFSEIEEFPEL